jgi:putative oxidoreductase
MDFIFLAGRILFGGYFAMSGWNHLRHSGALAGYAASKKVTSPKAMVILSGLMVLLGGLGIVFGVFVGVSVLLIVLFLIPVTFIMHNYWAETDPNTKMAQRVAFMKNIALIGGALAFIFIPGPWPWSL